MKMQRIVIIVFTVLGILAGFISSRLDVIFAVAASLVLGLVPILPMMKFFPGKKERTWLMQNSIITFVLVWLVVWILLFSG
jgi:hypothetical protein